MEYRVWLKVGSTLGAIKVKASSKKEAKKIVKDYSPKAVIGIIEKVAQ